MKDLVPSFCLTISVITMLFFFTFSPSAKGSMIAIFDPRSDQTEIVSAITASGAHILRLGKMPGTVMVWSDLPESPKRLREAGALLVLDSAAAFLCGETQESINFNLNSFQTSS